MESITEQYKQYLRYSNKLEILGYTPNQSWVKILHCPGDSIIPETFALTDINIGDSGTVTIPDFVTDINNGNRYSKNRNIKIIYKGNKLNSVYGLLNKFDVDSVDLSEFNFKHIKLADRLFESMTNLKKLVIPKNFGESLLYANRMFAGTKQLEEIDLRGFDLSQLVSYTYMLRAQGIKRLYVGKIGQSHSKQITFMVRQCFNLEEIYIEKLNIAGAKLIYTLISNCQKLRVLKIRAVGSPNKLIVKNLILNCDNIKCLDIEGIPNI